MILQSLVDNFLTPFIKASPNSCTEIRKVDQSVRVCDEIKNDFISYIVTHCDSQLFQMPQKTREANLTMTFLQTT